jgi:hypothetical protein
MARGTTPPVVTPADYRLVFEEHPVGVLVLEDLIKRFVRPPVLEGGIDAVLQTFARSGQRIPLDFIMNQVNRANGVSPLQGETDDPAA